MNCLCGHPPHHHAGGYQCGTITVTGPPDEIHDHRDIKRCDCPQYQP